jgi:glycosyltransferase involved in cell wall biosynthesis
MDDRQSIIMCDKERRPKYTDYGWFATNYAQNFTTGDYICYLSDDDYFLSSDGLEKIVHQIDNEDVVLFPLSYDGGILSPNNPVFEHIDGQQILHKPIVRGEPVRCQYSSFYGEDGYFINRLWGIAESKKAIQDPPLVHHTRWRHGDFI